MKDVVTISTVTFNAAWGEKAQNLNRIKGYIEAAAKKGSDIVVFPEMALTGYDDESEKAKPEKMQSLQAELIPGPATGEIEELTKKFGIYCVMGMPERDPADSSIIYNALAVFTPEGCIGSYRKMQLPPPEPNWANRGDKPFILDTPWGPVGIAICYDSYCFPEMTRYYGAKGCRLYINSTALAKCHGISLGSTTLEANVIVNQMYIASSNLGGKDLYNEFWGGSSIIGPSRNFWEVFYYAGHKFTDEVAIESEMFTATIDLTLADRTIFKHNPAVGSPDFRPDKYIEMYSDILTDPDFGK
ncbi:MAG TPA: carbon-nitrogen hydrolase family protein [Syntrophomonadaceae bacterium]|nr:carbon-nitrogen hydrolase family protein [Syntrophomonadaceae bacterium]